MNFYIASKLENHEQVKYVASLLKNKGWLHTYDWTVHGSVKTSGPEALREVSQNEYNGVKSADVVIVLTPQGRGTHTELGMAISLNKRVYIYHPDDTYFRNDDNTSSFYWLPQVKRVTGAVEDMVDAIVQDI